MVTKYLLAFTPQMSKIGLKITTNSRSKQIPETFQTPKQIEFLAKKSQMVAMLAATKTPEEMQAILFKFQPGSSSVKPESFSSTAEPSVNLDEDYDGSIFENFEYKKNNVNFLLE